MKEHGLSMNIAFCFDEYMAKPACVAAASLLDSKNLADHYHIYCITDEKGSSIRSAMEAIIQSRDPQSSLTFITAPKQYAAGYEVRGISNSTYLRLSLHRLLPSADKIIYADVDVLFCGSLSPVWEKKQEDHLLTAVKGTNNFRNKWEECMERDYADELKGAEGLYINAGILLMNLKEIRKSSPDAKWQEMSERQYHYQDQDILNITCMNRIDFLPPIYNRAANLTDREFLQFAKEGIYSREECRQALENPVIMHYTGEKPWNNRGTNLANLWWNYVQSKDDLKDMFDKKKVKYRKNTGLLGKINRHLPF